MSEQINERELPPPRPSRFVEATSVIEMFRDAPPVDWTKLKHDLDEWVNPEIKPDI